MPVRPRLALVCDLRVTYSSTSNSRIQHFHTSSSRLDNVDYYEDLQVPHNASASSIKKQFYALSKLHHPDHNPKDPTASARFVKISEAYAVLGHPTKRERYDRETQRSGSPRTSRQGSHSSSSSPPFGARPASGLSKRRTQFRGPPPSFYRSGGWGAQGAKRAAGYEGGAAMDGTAGKTNHTAGRSTLGGGFSAGQTHRSGWNDVPHFDRASHLWTQEQHERRRKRRLEDAGVPSSGRGGDMIFNFLMVTGVIILASLTPGIYDTMMNSRRNGNESK